MKEKKYNEWLQDVIGDIDDELLLETEELRNRKFLSNYQKIQNDIKTKSEKENDIKKSQSKMTNYFNQQTKKYNTEKENEKIQESYQEDDIKENSRELFFHQENKSEKQFVQESLSQELKEKQLLGLKENKKIKKRNNIWKTMGTLVACVSIFFIGSFCWKIGLFENYASDNIQNENAMYVTEQVECEQWQDEERDFENEPQNRSDNLLEQNIKDTSELADKNQQSDSMEQSEFPQQMQIMENEMEGNTEEKRGEQSENETFENSFEQEQNVSSSAPAVYIPKKEVSLAEPEGQARCMIAFFIYQDRVYVHYEILEHTKELVGKKLGTATGMIDAWTTKDGYVNFAGSVKGDFYEVNGYEQEFMLCIPMENGDTWLFINDNDLLLRKGIDIFEKYLHLSEKSYKAFYMTNKVWNNEKSYEEKKTAVNTEDYPKIEALLHSMNEGSFILTKDAWKDCGINAFYDEKQLYHLYLEMEDGMRIHLRIFEGGYVMFDGVSDVCVKIKR